MQGITLLFVGQAADDRVSSFLDEYVTRTSRFVSVDVKTLPEPKTTKNTPPSLQKELEGASVLEAVTQGDEVFLLDEKGKEYTSREFAGLVEKMMMTTSKRLVFVVGGPYGFSDAVYKAFPRKISLSRMTLNHRMVRIFLAEQVYRALSIIRNLPYHHD